MGTENNILIAKFMGGHPHDSRELDDLWINDKKFPHGFINIIGSAFKYNSDWGWLMGVVEHIEHNLESDYYFNTNHNSVWFRGIEENFNKYEITSSGRMQAVYSACVDFIKWYNLDENRGKKN